MEQKFDFVEVTLEPKHYEEIKEVYRLHKEQARKIFDLACGITSDEDIMDYVKQQVEYNLVFLGIDKETQQYAGTIILEDVCVYGDEIARANCHLAVNKKYWGKNSRQLIFDFYKYMEDNMKPVKRLEAFVPSNNFGIIKLLKDVGFKVEGTLKNRLVFKNKKDIPTYYNELVYSNINLGERNG